MIVAVLTLGSRKVKDNYHSDQLPNQQMEGPNASLPLIGCRSAYYLQLKSATPTQISLYQYTLSTCLLPRYNYFHSHLQQFQKQLLIINYILYRKLKLVFRLTLQPTNEEQKYVSWTAFYDPKENSTKCVVIFFFSHSTC